MFLAQQVAERSVITNHVKTSGTACTAPNTCKQSQYEQKRLITPVGTLNRNTALFKMFGEMAFFEYLEKLGSPP